MTTHRVKTKKKIAEIDKYDTSLERAIYRMKHTLITKCDEREKVNKEESFHFEPKG